MTSRLPLLILAAMFVPLLLSCTVAQRLEVRADASAVASVRVELLPAFADWLASMNQEAEALGVGAMSGVFDLQAIRSAFASMQGATLTRLESPSRTRLDMTVELADATAFPAATPVIAIEQRGPRRLLTIRLDYRSYAALRPLIPGSENALLDALGPQQPPYGDSEYDDLLAFTVGEEAPAWLRGSRVELLVSVPGRVVLQQGGRTESGRSVRFEVPLRELLLLRRSLEYAIEYEP